MSETILNRRLEKLEASELNNVNEFLSKSNTTPCRFVPVDGEEGYWNCENSGLSIRREFVDKEFKSIGKVIIRKETLYTVEVPVYTPATRMEPEDHDYRDSDQCDTLTEAMFSAQKQFDFEVYRNQFG